MDTNVISTYAEADQALTSAWRILSRIGVARPDHADLFGYFKSLDEVMSALRERDEMEAVQAVLTHVDYLAGKAGTSVTMILGGGYFSASIPVIQEALVNIATVLEALPERPPAGIPDAVFALILEAEAKLAGWCSREKAVTIARTVLQEKPRTCVEIGIFGGRSLVPCAAALQQIGAGTIYGIEAWSPHIAVENATNEVNDDWWSKVDFASIKQEFYRFVAATDLTRHVRLIEAPSGRAAGLFDEIDFLHIDGSHSVVNAAQDVLLYVPKVRPGGIVVFDDINWPSTAPARELLTAFCDIDTMLKDPDSGREICAVLRRRA